MNCERFSYLIEDLVEGELDRQTAGRVERHLSGCRECAARHETLLNEKRLYSRYLFNVEPSKNLWAVLEREIIQTPDRDSIAQKSSGTNVWTENLLLFFKLKTAWAAIACLLLLAAGFGFFKLANNETTENAGYLSLEARKISEPSPLEKVPPDSLSKEESKPEKSFSPSQKMKGEARPAKNIAVEQAINRVPAKALLNKGQSNGEQLNKFAAGRREAAKLPVVRPPVETKLLPEADTANLEKDAARQVEKIELLLRSFRNARAAAGSTVIDVSYEKQQARRLLGKNVELRQIAESCGDFYTEEILDKAESILLDIANLEIKPAPEKIDGIKERVKSQNLIAGLQVY